MLQLLQILGMAVTAEQVDWKASYFTTGTPATSAWPLTAISVCPPLTLCEMLKWMENSDDPTLSLSLALSCSGHIKMSNVCGAIQPMGEYIIPLRLSWQWWMSTMQALQSHPPVHSFIMTPLSCLLSHAMPSERRSTGTDDTGTQRASSTPDDVFIYYVKVPGLIFFK